MTSPSEAHYIRVASYNVRGLKDDRGAVIDVVRAIAPDVLLLQEVPRHPLSGHRIANLADDLGLTWFGGKRFRMSTTVMTSLRLDVLQARHGRLPVRRFDEPRGFGMATVRLPGHRPLVTCSAHLSLRAADRLPEVKALLAEAGPQASLVVGGDLNEEPGDAAWRHLAHQLREVSPAAPTYSAADPHKQIDAVFASADLPGTAPRPQIDPALLARASDHLPVVVDLDLCELAE